MVVFHIISDSFLAISDKLCIFAPMDAKNTYLSDQEIVEGLIADNDYVINKFFKEQFTIVVDKIKDKIFTNETSFESAKAWAFNDIYEHLKATDHKWLREFDENKGTLVIWLARKAIEFYQNARKTPARRKKLLRERENKENVVTHNGQKGRLSPPSPHTPEYELEYKEVMEKAESAIASMKNSEYQEIMRRLIIEENYDPRIFALDWNVPYANLSEDKKRAVFAFLKIYFPNNYKEIIRKNKKKRHE